MSFKDEFESMILETMDDEEREEAEWLVLPKESGEDLDWAEEIAGIKVMYLSDDEIIEMSDMDGETIH